MARPKQKECKNGHLLKKPNLIFRERNGRKIRECRICARERLNANRAKARARVEEKAKVKAVRAKAAMKASRNGSTPSGKDKVSLKKRAATGKVSKR
jgi:hypothetical protein